MKNRLQYIYSIAVFIGVFITAYLMIDRENMRPFTARDVGGTNPTLRQDAAASDPALNQLFQMEEALAQMKKEREKSRERVPSARMPKLSND